MRQSPAVAHEEGKTTINQNLSRQKKVSLGRRRCGSAVKIQERQTFCFPLPFRLIIVFMTWFHCGKKQENWQNPRLWHGCCHEIVFRKTQHKIRVCKTKHRLTFASTQSRMGQRTLCVMPRHRWCCGCFYDCYDGHKPQFLRAIFCHCWTMKFVFF